MHIQFDEDKQNKKIGEFRKKEEEDLAEIIAGRNGLPYADLSLIPINMDALRLIPEPEARAAQVAGVSLVGKKLKIAVVSPAHPKINEIVKNLSEKGYECSLLVVSLASVAKAHDRYKDLSFSVETKSGALDISSMDIQAFMAQVKNTADVKKLVTEIKNTAKGLKITKVLEIILSGGLATKASDIHIEPEETYARIRYRLDGVLNEITDIELDLYNLLLSRIKLLSGLKINVKGEAQDGRFSINIGDDDIEVRTSTLPGTYSESIVLRILNPKSIRVPLEELGIPEKLLGAILREIQKPNGMILTTGPTGSGKTTTLYAFLRKIHEPGVKIITIEDPIEYHLPGITQTQVSPDKGYTFAAGLRAALRQDPDVIMVGEVRDEETAEIAINSALTGHLVFSTLHTNSAAGTYPRLIDLEVNPKVITSAINLSLAQRLLRKLCANCKKERGTTSQEKQTMDKVLFGIEDKKIIEGIKTDIIWDAVGCEKCNHTGYSGRVGIYEAIISDNTLAKVVQENPNEREIREATKNQGLLSMKEDGVIKVLKGVTTLTELERVIDVESELN